MKHLKLFENFDNSYYQSLIKKIQSVLTPDLLKGMWNKKFDNPLAGHCYVAAETLYWMLGGPESDWKTYVLIDIYSPQMSHLFFYHIYLYRKTN